MTPKVTPRDDATGQGIGDRLRRFRRVRAHSLDLTRSLSAEDQCIQSMPDASPIKWHLAHPSWFFEAVVLAYADPGYAPYDERHAFIFNSYYEQLGERHPRPERGMLTRPSLDEVLAYRRHVDEQVEQLIERLASAPDPSCSRLIELGLQHEQQHQELMLMDILHAFSRNPLRPAVFDDGENAGRNRLPSARLATAASGPLQQHRSPDREAWASFDGGLAGIGMETASDETASSPQGFHFDNESPRHRVFVEGFSLATRLVTNAEYQAFVDDGGYRNPGWWLSDGWATVCAQRWSAPLYWLDDGMEFSLFGVRHRAPGAPVMHLSFYEAAAYAEWAGARLPTEFEWEHAQVTRSAAFEQMHGAAWQWTRTAYGPWPRFRPWRGAIGEYNGKFMSGQMVLRGSSLGTPEGHERDTYRNFFPPAARWMFSGVRLARDDG